MEKAIEIKESFENNRKAMQVMKTLEKPRVINEDHKNKWQTKNFGKSITITKASETP